MTIASSLRALGRPNLRLAGALAILSAAVAAGILLSGVVPLP